MSISSISGTYPNIHRHHDSVGGQWGRMEQLYEDANMSLPALDAALEAVGIGGSAALQGVAADLFSDDLGKVLAAICEYLAFGWLTSYARLAQTDIGYPATWAGEDPPFEGVLRADTELAFDVKDGSGSGMSLLRDVLQRQVDAHVGPNQEPPEVHVALNAPTGQRWVNENFNRIVGPFRQELRANGIAARTLRYDAGSGHILVGIDRRVGASISGLREKASFIARQIVDHAQHKAALLRQTAATSFFLVYVRRPGSGLSDFSDETLCAAADFLAGRGDLPDSFSGVLFLNFEHVNGRPGASARCWDRSNTLAAVFGGSVQVHEASPAITPEQRTALARDLDPAAIEPTTAVMMGSCDLRGQDCLAPGSAGSVFAFFHRDEQYTSCQRCRSRFDWPTPQVL